MSQSTGDGIVADRPTQGNTATERPRRLSTETKAAFKTTEL
jgi:hypothetical protein